MWRDAKSSVRGFRLAARMVVRHPELVCPVFDFGEALGTQGWIGVAVLTNAVG